MALVIVDSFQRTVARSILVLELLVGCSNGILGKISDLLLHLRCIALIAG